MKKLISCYKLLFVLFILYGSVYAQPNHPSNLTATAISSSQIDLGWTESDSTHTVSGFGIERSLNGLTWSPLASIGPVLTYSNTGLAASTTYYYRVYASNGNGNSGYSNVVHATTLGAVTDAPTNLVVTSNSLGVINLQWNDNCNTEISYQVFRKLVTTPGSGWLIIGTIGPNSTTYSDNTVIPNNKYQYKVWAQKPALPHHTGYSNFVSVTAFGSKTLITNLIAYVISLKTAGLLTGPQKNTLVTLLNAANSALAGPFPESPTQAAAASSALSSFILYVGLYTNNPLPPTQANDLITQANAIMALISNFQSPIQIIESTELTPKYALHDNYPNPFNPVTKISFDIPMQGLVTLKIYDILGREVRTLVNEVKSQGSYTVDFNGSELSSGVYFYRIQSAGFTDIKRMTLVK